MQIRGIVQPGIRQEGHSLTNPSKQPPMRFGNWGRIANWVTRAMPTPLDTNVAGLSLEDIANRTSLTASVYIPQGLMAIWERQGPFEVWSRNILTLIGAVAITLFCKHPTVGVNTFSNQFMVPKQPLAPLPQGLFSKAKLLMTKPGKAWERFVNMCRPNYNYLELFKEAGLNLKSMGYKGGENLAEGVLKNAVWASVDKNEKQLLCNFAKKGDLVKSVLKRIFACKTLSVLVSGALMTAITGIGVQLLVFGLFAPLDRQFFGDKPKKKMNTPNGPEQEAIASYMKRRQELLQALQLSGTGGHVR